MSRTKKGEKGAGYDYWTKRPYSSSGYGPVVKKLTKKKERAMTKQQLSRIKKGKDD